MLFCFVMSMVKKCLGGWVLIYILWSGCFAKNWNCKMTVADENSWRMSPFRQNVVTKIDEAIRQFGINTSRNSLEMENHVFQNAKNKEEYLGYIARLILHMREMREACETFRQNKANIVANKMTPSSG